jgi:antitoxin YefM
MPVDEAMTIVTAADSQTKIHALLEQTAAEHKPLMITGPTSNGVLLAEEDWNSLQETLYLYSIPGMRESLVAGLREPLEECSTDTGW